MSVCARGLQCAAQPFVPVQMLVLYSTVYGRVSHCLTTWGLRLLPDTSKKSHAAPWHMDRDGARKYGGRPLQFPLPRARLISMRSYND